PEPHREVVDAVLDEHPARDLEAERPVPVDEVRLGVDDDGTGSVDERSAHERSTEPPAPRVGRGDDATDAGRAVVLHEDPEARDGTALLLEPPVESVGLGVATVELGVRAALLDDE